MNYRQRQKIETNRRKIIAEYKFEWSQKLTVYSLIFAFFNFFDNLNNKSILCNFINNGANMMVDAISIAHGLNKHNLLLLGPINAKIDKFIKNAPIIKI